MKLHTPTMTEQRLLETYAIAPTSEGRHTYAWDRLREETHKLFAALPTDLRVRFVSGQPYATAQALHNVFNTRQLLISTDFNFHPLWDEETNLRFRAVHDYYGHILTGFDFTLEGELNAYLTCARLHTDSAKHALFTEVYVQALWHEVYGEFPKQKVVLL